ncbi:HdeD family acid-resistance protein [Sphingobacterium lactis]|uniref:HdeD family acid-resistance protein n=1 Tax=Sphingobacterium lactis TaxID=797291 RepID=UPI003EC75870
MKYWYLPLILGILLIVCGIYVFTAPLETYVTLSVLFSISFVVSGLFDIIFSLSNRKSISGSGWYLVSGLLSFLMGIYLIIYPGISITILPFVAGFVLMFRSFQLLGFSFDLRDIGILRWGNLAVWSVLGILLSFMLIANPFFSGISLVVLTGSAFILAGISSVFLAFDLKKIKDFPKKLGHDLKSRIQKLQEEIEEAVKK